MPLTAEKQMQHLGETPGMEDHDHDLVHELGKRLDALWRYDQYIANAEGKVILQNLWRDLQSQDREAVMKLKALISEEIEAGCF